MFHAVSADFKIEALGPITRQLADQFIRSPQAVQGIDLNHDCVEPGEVNLIRVI